MSIFNDNCECKMKKSEIIGILALAVIATIAIGEFICYFNAPPYGAAGGPCEIVDSELSYNKEADGCFSIQVNVTICYEHKTYDIHFDPLPVRIIVEIQTNETLGINRKTVSSKNISINMSYNETFSFVENLSVLETGTYRVEIEVFFLTKNNFWGTRWMLSDGKYAGAITVQ